MKRTRSNNGDSLSISQIIWIAITITLVLGIGGVISSSIKNRASNVGQRVQNAGINTQFQPSNSSWDTGGQSTDYQKQMSDLNNQMNQIKNKQNENSGNGQSITDLKNQTDNITALVNNIQQQIQITKQNQGNSSGLISNLQNQMNGLNNQLQKTMADTGNRISDLTQQLGQAKNNNDNGKVQDLSNQLQSLSGQYQNLSNLTNNQGSSISELQSHDIYKVSTIDDSTDLSKLKKPGTYSYWLGSKGKGIAQLQGAENMGQVLQAFPDTYAKGINNGQGNQGFDQGYATIIVSPQLGTWQTQTLIGANGISLVRSMNNGQDFNSKIDSREMWHIATGADVNTMLYKGDITNQDLNQWFQTGIYKISGPITNAPTGDWAGTLTVINDGSMVTEQLDTQDTSSPNQTQRWFRQAAGGQWHGWERVDGGTEFAQLGPGSSLFDPITNNWPDGMYKVNQASRDAPFNVAHDGILFKHTGGPDTSLTFYDGAWNAIYVNYYGWGHWSGWREITN